MTVETSDSFDIADVIPYLINDRWPAAVDPLLIADQNSEPDKFSRAHAIINMVLSTPIGKETRFLDFGCGEGHVVNTAADQAGVAVGYDAVVQGWDRFPVRSNQVFTSDWSEVVKNRPYNIVLLYDVLDHAKDENDAIMCLRMIKDVLAPEGRVFVRCHPWCSRHGTHLYQKLNKAYIHMFLTDAQLESMGAKGLPTIKVIHPLQTYSHWFDIAGLRTLSNSVVREVVESFFLEPTIAGIIKSHWKNSSFVNLANGTEFPSYQCSQQFVDYVLAK